MARKFQSRQSGHKDSAAVWDKKNEGLVYAGLYTVNSSGYVSGEDPQAAFLLNPESLTDDISSNWVENTIPGQSDPVLQWVSGGPRNVSFTALVTKDTAIQESSKSTNLANLAVGAVVNAVGSIASKFAGVNISALSNTLLSSSASDSGEEHSIATHLDYYRSLMYPNISNDSLESSPPLVVLAYGKTLSGFNRKAIKGDISADGMDLWAVKNVSIKVNKWLPNLAPMEAEVTFQLVQYRIKSAGSSAFGKTVELDKKNSASTAIGIPPNLFPTGLA